MSYINIELEEGLCIGVDYSQAPLEKAFFNHTEGYGSPEVGGNIEEVVITSITVGTLDGLCYYISETDDFYGVLNEKIEESL